SPPVPKAGARCGRPARWDLGGGRAEPQRRRPVPTATVGCSRGRRRSVDRGGAGWVIEPRNARIWGADALQTGGRQHRRRRYREPSGDPTRSENLGTYRDLHAREPGGPTVARPWG